MPNILWFQLLKREDYIPANALFLDCWWDKTRQSEGLSLLTSFEVPARRFPSIKSLALEFNHEIINFSPTFLSVISR